jgi:hypothetical protein
LVGERGKAETSADEVIANLTGPSPADEAMETESAPAAPSEQARRDQSDEVIDELLGDLYEDDAPRRPGSARAEAVEESPDEQDIDSSVIEGLLGENQDKDKNP